MIRLAARALKQLLLTLALLVGSVCAIEIALRCHRVANPLSATGREGDVPAAALVIPNRATYVAPTPELRLQQKSRAASKPYLLRTNGFGLRNSEVAVPKPGDVYRILCLGDDTTFAADQPEAATYCRRLAAILRKEATTHIEVLNGGCPGGCPTVAALLMRHHFLGLGSDLVLLHVDPSDLADEVAMRRYVERSGDGAPVAAIHPAVTGTAATACQVVDQFLIARMARDSLESLWKERRSQSQSDVTRDDGPTFGDESPYRDIRNSIAAISEMTRRQGVRLMVSTTATPKSAGRGRDQRRAEDPQGEWPSRELIAICKELKIPLIDATDFVLDAGDSLGGRKRISGRLTAAEHQGYADALADELLGAFAPDSAPAVEQTGGQR
jgi:hypothetical protein